MTNKQHRTAKVAATLLLSILSACGGGGGSAGGTVAVGTLGTATVSGTAATGKAISNAPVQAVCAQGVFTATTNAQGAFSIALSSDAPCVLSTTVNGHALRAVYRGGNVVNITPLTELLTQYLFARAGLSSTAPASDAVDNAILAALVSNSTEIDRAQAAVQARVLAQYGVDVGGSFLTESLVSPATDKDPQNDADKILDRVSAAGGFDARQSPQAIDSSFLIDQASSQYTHTGLELETGSKAIEAVQGKAVHSAVCFNPGMFTDGYQFKGSYALDQGDTKGAFTITQTVLASTFDNQPALALKTSNSLNGLVDSQFFTTSGTDINLLGEESTTVAQGKTLQERTIYSPAVLEKDYDLRMGESQSRVLAGRTLSSTSLNGGTPTQSALPAYSTQKITFTGLEAVDTPAGRYLACRMDEEDQSNAGPENSIFWYGVGSGTLLKVTYLFDDGQGGATEAHIKLTDAEINGSAFP